MTIGALLALAITFWAGISHAERVRVYSGEHEDFSRVVFVFSSLPAWQHDEVDDRHRIRFAQNNMEMDLSGIFDKMPKTRIQDVSFQKQSGTVEIVVSPSSNLKIFVAGDGAVAIDVTSKPPSTARTMALTDAGAASARVFPFGPPKLGLPSKPDSPAQQPPNALRGGGVPAPKPQALARRDSPNNGADDLRRLLLKNVNDAAVTDDIRLRKPPQQQPDTNGVPGKNAPSSAHMALGGVKNVTKIAPAFPDQEVPERCLLEGPQFWPTWLDTTPQLSDIYSLRIRLAETPEEIPPSEIEDLIRKYLGLGFGAEAALLADEYQNEISSHEFYRAIGEVLESGVFPDRSEGEMLQSCTRYAPLSVQTSGTQDDLQVAARNLAVLAGQIDDNEYIPHPQISALARSLDNGEFAGLEQWVNGILEIGPANLGNIFAQLEAGRPLSHSMEDIRLRDGNVFPLPSPADSSRKMLNSLQRWDPSPAAIGETLTALEGVGNEFRDTQEGQNLLAIAAAASAKIGSVSNALAIHAQLTVVPNSTTSTDVDPVLSAVVGAVVARGRPDEILELVLSPDLIRNGSGLDPAIARDLVDTLFDLKLPQLAEEFLDHIPSEFTSDLYQERAMAALSANAFSKALWPLMGRDEGESRLLQAEALVGLGDHRKAAEIYADLGISDMAQSAAWLSGDPELVAEFGSDEMKHLLADDFGERPRHDGDLSNSRPSDGQEIQPSDDSRHAIVFRAQMLLTDSRNVRESLESVNWLN